MIKKIFSRKNLTAIAIISIITGYIFLPTKPAQGFFNAVGVLSSIPDTTKEIKDSIVEAIIKAGRVSFLSSLRSLVNQFAYDTATYIGSGGKGQKPVYFTKEFGPWLQEQGANVGGQFIEEFAKTDEGSFIKKYDICSPDLSVSIRIALGLTDYASKSRGLSQSRCNLKEIYESGRDQVELYRDPEYLKNLALTAFDPSTTDVGAALTLNDQIGYRVQKEKEGLELQRLEDKGWISPQGIISNQRKAPPGIWELKLKEAKDLQVGTFFDRTGDIFVDATNIFLNKLALTAFNKLIENLSKNTSSSSSSSSNYYSQGTSGGITEVARKNSSILQARFNEVADYDILSELSSCRDENKPGPNNCVITSQFAQAVEERLTVAEAISLNYIDAEKRLGFNSQGGEISYKDGYPYRSLIILRKFRILPVGWEVAAQYIKDNASATKDITLKDLINCFAVGDSYQGLQDEWCRGLIDPNWVLKVPKQFCGMEGYGPEILQSQVVPSAIGYCTKSEDDCSSKNSSLGNCASNFMICFKESDCSSFGEYKYCNSTVAKENQVIRNDSYCADEQSCIKENTNGSCAYYGYCTEEKRRWVFNQSQDNSCEPRNNTCQTFKNESGQEAAFLENTLDYNFCDAGQVGCKQYAISGPYDKETKKIGWDADAKQVYFNKNVSACEISGEGCHQYIRTKDNLDTNLIGDASFEDSKCNDSEGGELYDGECQIYEVNPGPGDPGLYNLPALPPPYDGNDRWYILVNDGLVKAGIVQTEVDDGTQSLYIEGSGTLFSNPAGPGITPHSFLPEDFQFVPGHYYTLSARVYPKTSAAFAGFGLLGANHVDSTVLNQWQTLVVTFYYPFGTVDDNRIFVGSRGGIVYVDSVKLTAGRASTTYNDYGSRNVINQKILPTYLEDTCYQFNVRVPYRLKTDAPEECYKFAKKCNANEVGCESFTSLDTGIAVTAKTTAQDSCPGTCVGYNTYVQQANAFNAKQAVNLIPATAKTCGAQAVGCTAFTNLDKLSQGGEAIEYYSAMRKCIKPDASRCLPFYTWEGSDESGYQLKVYSLQRDPGSRLGGEEPLSTLPATEEALLCNASIYQKLPSEPGYNYDCRQFYAQDGTVSYHLYQKTISCSDDCHPYRRELNTASACLAGNGEWDATQSRCLYYAIPGEGTICAAADAGCQEYTGNIASNTRNIFTVSTFEDNDNAYEGWEDRSELTRVNTALNLGGHSLLGNTFTKLVGEGVKRNKSYTVSFLARASVPTAISNIELFNGARPLPDRAIFSTSGTSITTDWKLYSFNLTTLDHEVTSIPRPLNLNNIGEKLKLSFANEVFIDNIRLTEVPNRFYLISNSWTIPDECDEDLNGSFAPGYMLGCSQYKNADSTTVNLHSFTDLCDDVSAGCEALIDTFNSTEYKAKIVNDDNDNKACDPNEKSCIYTPADKIVYAIYDRTKQCEVANKGCQRMGLASTYDTDISFSDIYINNNPDRYGTVACKAEAVGCSKWTSPDGDTYFKDPGKEVCEWRLKAGTSNQYEWYKKDVKRCDGNGSICASDSDCGSRQKCTDAPCDSTPHKTLGEGGKNNKVLQPSSWAGLCESSQAGCNELIDPISSFNISLIKNPSYQPSSSGIGADFWEEKIDSGSGGQLGVAVQRVTLDLHTTYILKGNSLCKFNDGNCRSTDDVYINKCRINDSSELSVVYQLNSEDNIFYPLENSYTALISGSDRSLEFYIASRTIGSTATSATCEVWRRNTTVNNTVELRQAVISYQLTQNLDKQSSNGLASFNKGLILFNERKQNGSRKASLQYNADSTGDGGIDGVSPNSTPPPLNANVIIKAKSDRTCSKWLDCNSYIVDPNNPKNQVCLEVGLCDSLDSEGQCNNFIEPEKKNQNIKNLGDVSKISNLTGYSKVGYHRDLALRGGLYLVSTLGDYYNLANMSQTGDSVSIPDGDFEKIDQYDPTDDDPIYGNSSWTPIIGNLRILLEPGQLQNEGLKPIHIIKNNSSASGGYLPPAGSGLAQVSTSGVIEQTNPISLISNKNYVISAYMYSKGGSAEIKLKYIKSNGTSDTITLLTTTSDPNNEWLYKSAVFNVPVGNEYKLQLVSSVDGNAYFDDIRIESGLNIRCSDPEKDPSTCIDPAKPPVYSPSTCRLFPSEDSLSCIQTDRNNIIHKGIKGYCLEYDPKFSDTCLLWYPLDKIASDQTEEGLGLNLPTSMYYCLKTDPICPAWSGYNVPFNSYSGTGFDIGASAYNPNNNGTLFFNRLSSKGPDKPIYQCSAVTKVNSDKYWRTRLVASSSYEIKEGAMKSIHFVPSMGGDVSRNLNASNIYGYFESLTMSVQREYTQMSDLSPTNSGTPYINSNDNKVCRGYVAAQDNHANDCSESVFGLGEWDNCACDWSSASNCDPFGNCTAGEFGCNMPAPWNKLCIAEKNGNVWIGKTTDQESNGGSPDYSTSRFDCSSNAGLTYHTVKSPEPERDLLSSLFVEGQTYNWSGGSYVSASTINIPSRLCGRDGTTNYPSFCSGDSSRSCTSDAGCVGKGICFMRRSTITSSGSFNYETDYCYIAPKVFDFTINSFKDRLVVTNGSKEVSFVYNTKTDADQLPLKELIIDLGYRNNEGIYEQIKWPVGNYGDSLRYINKVLTYENIKQGDDGNIICAAPNDLILGSGSTPLRCGENRSCCFIKPKVMIKDNWDRCNGGACTSRLTYGLEYGNYIRVDQN